MSAQTPTIEANLVQKLRQMTGAGIMDCKRALSTAKGDVEAAIRILREQGIAQAGKRALKTASDGLVTSYIHPGSKVGVLLELNCETDFVARTEEFQNMAKEITLQIAAANPKWVSRESVPPEEINREKEIYLIQAKKEGKPPEIAEKMSSGRLEKFYQEFCLLDQPYIRDTSGKTRISNVITDVAARLGENIVVKRFVRFKVGEE